MKKFLKKAFWPSILLTIVVLIKYEQHAWAYTLFSFVVIVLAIMLYINSNEKFYQNVLEKSEVHVSQIEKLLNITKKPTPGMYTTSSGDNISFLYKRLSIIEDELRQINATNLSTCKPNKSFVKASDRNPVFMSKITASKYISRMDNVRFDRGMNMVQNLHLPCKISCDITSSRSHHITYKTTLTSCTCPDFDNEKEPCKHMIALALAVGALLPVSDSIIEFNGAGMSDEIDHLNITRNSLALEIELLNKQLENTKDDLEEFAKKTVSAEKKYYYMLSSLSRARKIYKEYLDRNQVLVNDDDLMEKYIERFTDDRFERGVAISKDIATIKKNIKCSIECKIPSASIPNKHYDTTLYNCSCKDYDVHGLPCKHMIALALATKVIQPIKTERNTSCPTAST